MPPDVDDALPELQASRAALAAVAADLDRDRTERKRANRIARWAVVVGLALAVIDLVALGFIIQGQNAIQQVQSQSSERGKRIEQSTLETHRTAVNIDCALSASRAGMSDREAFNLAFDECVKKAG